MKESGRALRRPYHDLNEMEAKILYLILRLQYNPADVFRFDQTQMGQTLGGVAQERISESLGPLEQSGYIVAAPISRARGERGPKQIYEVQANTAITCRDTAVFLLELLNYPGKGKEGMVNLQEFVPELVMAGKFNYLSATDIFGTSLYAGKIAELTLAGQHIERLSERHIRPRLRLFLERRFLQLVAQQPAISELAAHRFDGEKWANRPSSPIVRKKKS